MSIGEGAQGTFVSHVMQIEIAISWLGLSFVAYWLVSQTGDNIIAMQHISGTLVT